MVLQGSEIIEDFRSSSRHGGRHGGGGHGRHGGHKGSIHKSRRMPHSGNGYSRWGGHGGKRSHCGSGRCGNNNYGNYGNFDQYSYPAFFSSAPFLGYAYSDYYPYEFGAPTIPYYSAPIIQVQEDIQVKEEEPVGQVVNAVNAAENRIITNLVLFAILGACVYMIIKK